MPKSKTESTVAPAVMTMRDAAAYVGLNYDHFRGRVYYDIPHIQYRVGGRVYFEKRDLDVWLDRHKQRPVDDRSKRQDAQCPCGSGRMFKRCHGRAS